MRIPNAPFGLNTVDFYDGPAVQPYVERSQSIWAANGYFVKVNNALSLRLADSYFNGTDAEWEQAKQWLFDMVKLRGEE